ncbi:MAG: type II toxin-antitoxin system PemK/MazF family toxin [Deltaproteobacteria bacterium]|nr:type II toxin-antitoxin system PemK/MazF family toxin [Deltaproteobacteria bacterium]
MNRGDLYRVYRGSKNDPRRQRVFVVVSRQVLLESRFSTVICAPIYSSNSGLSTQVAVDIEDGLKHASAVHCDELISLEKRVLTNFIGTLPARKIDELNQALAIALAIDG